MTTNSSGINKEIKVNGQNLQIITSFKYLSSIVSDEGSKLEILSRIAQATTALTKVKPIWNDRSIFVAAKVRPNCFLVTSIIPYACESWTFTAELQRRIRALEMRCYRKILRISYKDHVSNKEFRAKIQHTIGLHEGLSILKIETQTAVVWTCFPFIRFGQNHPARHNGRGKKTSRQRKRWEDNIRERWTGLVFAKSQRAAESREKWRKLVVKSPVVPRRPLRLRIGEGKVCFDLLAILEGFPHPWPLFPTPAMGCHHMDPSVNWGLWK